MNRLLRKGTRLPTPATPASTSHAPSRTATCTGSTVKGSALPLGCRNHNEFRDKDQSSKNCPTRRHQSAHHVKTMKTLSAQQSCICDEECDIQVKEDGPGPIIVPIMSQKSLATITLSPTVSARSQAHETLGTMTTIIMRTSEGDMRMMLLLWDATPGNRSLKIVEIPIKTTLNNPDFPEK